ncbi:unnamed protein product [Phytophthora fragariaefolia]|uniref:Unnamed protein product n=1 Tax=Phytophthora fragariaefolia TaxID=1490495 RepID=A0A9W7CRE4_9STRA|nr:unnamed protein product [Phytophthora fragariaefolia]
MPRTFRRDHLQCVLVMLHERENARRQELDEYPRVPQEHETPAPQCPLYDSVVADGGADSIVRLTNFKRREVNTVWMSVRSHITRYWNVGRDRWFTFTGKDVMIMMLVVRNNGSVWETLSSIFHVKIATFIKTIIYFVLVVAPRLYDDWVKEKAQEESKHILVTSDCTFVHYPYALYATDVTFQQGNRPDGIMAEALPYYCAKHKLYGYKVEVSVSPRGSAINCTEHARGNTHDITIFRRNEAFHHAM